MNRKAIKHFEGLKIWGFQLSQILGQLNLILTTYSIKAEQTVTNCNGLEKAVSVTFASSRNMLKPTRDDLSRVENCLVTYYRFCHVQFEPLQSGSELSHNLGQLKR